MTPDDLWLEVTQLINELAPLTRRDEWWAGDGPREILAKRLRATEADLPDMNLNDGDGNCPDLIEDLDSWLEQEQASAQETNHGEEHEEIETGRRKVWFEGWLRLEEGLLNVRSMDDSA